MKEDELQSILNYLLTMHEVCEHLSLLQWKLLSELVCHFAVLSYKVTFHLHSCYLWQSLFFIAFKLPSKMNGSFRLAMASQSFKGVQGAQVYSIIPGDTLQGTYIASLLQLQ